MVIRNVSYAHSKRMTPSQKKELEIPAGYNGIVAVETHNPEYKRKAVLLKKGIIAYIKGE